jgi:hypothetical protein
MSNSIKQAEKTEWDQAATDAKERIRELRRAINYFEEQKRKGAKWPTEKDKTADAD